jgi:hypothetical protein
MLNSRSTFPAMATAAYPCWLSENFSLFLALSPLPFQLKAGSTFHNRFMQ